MRLESIRVLGSDVVPGKIKWLWKNRIPIGELSMIAGNPGAGKTHIGLHIAAHVSTGRAWSDCKETPQEGVAIILTAEDSLKYTLVPRLMAAEANLENISFVSAAKIVTDDGEEKAIDIYQLPVFASLLQSEVDYWKTQGKAVRLIMIDPLAAYMGGKDENRNIEVRTFLAPLVQLASENELAIIGIAHLNKDMSKMAIFRMLGSIGFTAAARAVWLVVEDSEQEERRLFLPVKVNVAEKTDGLAYRLKRRTITTKDGPTIASVCEFEEALIAKTADEVFADHLIPTQTKIETARKWLKDFLAEKAIPIQEVIDASQQKRFAERTIRRAAQELNVEKNALVVGNKVLWMWKLPTKQTKGKK